MSARGMRVLAALCVVTTLLASVAAGLGVFARGDGSTVPVTSVRGEHYDMAVTGVYEYNAQRVVAEGAGWDVFTLFAAVPALLAVSVGVARGSLRARLLAIGLLGYLFYQYLMYAMTWAFGPLLPLFIAIYALAGVALVSLVASVDRVALANQLEDRFPARGVAALCIGMGLLLVAMWSQRIATGLSGDLDAAMLLGQTTMVVQALDLGLVVPLALATGVLAWRRSPWGYLLAAVFVVKAVAMAAAICAMLVSAALVEGVWNYGALAIFGGAAAAAAVLAARMYGSKSFVARG